MRSICKRLLRADPVHPERIRFRLRRLHLDRFLAKIERQTARRRRRR